MAKSNKPVVWGLFAAGGTLTAFLTPALVLLTLLPAFGVTPVLLSYEHMRGFAGGWPGRIMVFGILFPALWHAAHRMRITAHDFGLRADAAVAVVVYLAAAVGTVATAYYLSRI